VTRTDVAFASNGQRCAAWHYPGSGEAFAGEHGRPCVVMAHGFGGTRDTGLAGFAEAFAAAGLDVLLFDYRGFADSAGAPRQHVSYRQQRADYAAAIAAARQIAGVDAARIVLWGTSYSGGHVVPVGVADGSIAAAIAMTPAMDGMAALAALIRRDGPVDLLRLTGHGLRDVVRGVSGRQPHLVPLAARPGDLGFLTAPGALEGYTAVAGPQWRNEVCARAALEVALNRPTRHAGRVSFPMLVQVGELDQTVPAAATRRAARRMGAWATLRSYPLDHFDVYDGASWHDRVLADQLAFLTSTLSPTSERSEELT